MKYFLSVRFIYTYCLTCRLQRSGMGACAHAHTMLRALRSHQLKLQTASDDDYL